MAFRVRRTEGSSLGKVQNQLGGCKKTLKWKRPPPGAAFATLVAVGELDAHAVFAGRVLAGAGIEVVRGAALELVAAAQLPAHKNADRGYGHTHRKPRNYLQRFRLFRLFCGVGCIELG